ncbi:MAG TPA: metallophosphoesterase [Pseudolabrys sp.]|nr:metallophosphoesterase [Hyphomicrobiales bacterium]OJY11685.1 MAG: metallophosphatase [Rhizobiales bacterium 62-47]
MTAYTLAHLSDPHLPPMPAARLHQLAGKRAFGYLNWKRNRHAIHRREVLDLLVADMQAHQPDHIAITGDLVNLALPAEFAPARRWLHSVGPADRVTVVPGNHDAYVQSTRHHFGREFADYLCGDEATAGSMQFPFVRHRGPLALIGVSTAVPTAPLLATGKIGAAQFQALDRLLRQLADTQSFRVLLIHHPLRSDHHGRFKRLTDADELLTALRRHGVDLILHGHDHVHSTMWFDGPNGRIPAIGAPSASAVAHGHHPAAAYNMFSIERDGSGWRCEQGVRGLLRADHIGDVRRVRLF